MVAKQAIRKQLQGLGVAIPANMPRQAMHTLLLQETQLRNHDFPTKLGRAWFILLTQDEAFWKHFADIRVLGLLAKTCRAFRFHIPENEPAWQTIAHNMHRASKKCMAEVFLLPTPILAHLPFLIQPIANGTEAHLVSVYTCLKIAWEHHGGAKGVHAARRITVSRRSKNGAPHTRLRWARLIHTPTKRQERVAKGAQMYLQRQKRRRPTWTFATDYTHARTPRQAAMLQHSINREIALQRYARARHRLAPALSQSDIEEIRQRIHTRFFEREMIRVANRAH